MVCPNCGSENREGAKFCIGCGTPLSAPAAQAQPVYEQPVYEQPVYEQPVYAEPQYAQPTEGQPGKGLGIAAMIIGIVSLACLGGPASILAIIFGAISKSKGFKGGQATAGIVLGIIGIVIYVILMAIYGAAIYELYGF